MRRPAFAPQSAPLRAGGGYRFIITITDVTRQELTARELSLRVAERTRELTENNRLLAEEVQRQQAERTLLQTQDELIQAARWRWWGRR